MTTHTPELHPSHLRALRAILRRFPATAGGADRLSLVALSGGLINETYGVGDRWVLQRVHPIFSAAVNEDIAALTPHLRAAGVAAPELMRADTGLPCVRIPRAPLEATADDGAPPAAVWRLMNRLPGRTLHRLTSETLAMSAAELASRFHAALSGVQHTFRFTRPGAHDTAAHLATLREALTTHPDHRLYDTVAPVAAALEQLWAQQRGEVATALPRRIGHGDLKVSNLLFAATRPVATAIIDLDTMAWMPLDEELGDALRSWCNRAAEDAPRPQLDETIFDAALRGYARGAASWLTNVEREAIVAGMLRISTELAMRFAADALRECYFGWNPALAPTRGDHNLLRARNQLAFAQQIAAARSRLERRAREAFAAAG